MSLRQYIHCFHQLNDRLCTGGLSEPQVFAQLVAEGIQSVVSLLPASEADPGVHRSAAQQEGLLFLHIPVDGPSGLTAEAVAALDDFLQAHAEQRSLIYCASGNRCGALLALHAAQYQGASPDQALDIGRRAGLKSLEPYVAGLIGRGQAGLGAAQQ